MRRGVLIFANPTAGRGRGVALSDALHAALAAAAFDPHVHSADPATFVNRAALERALAIVVVGGDGTLRAVVEQCLHLIDAVRLPPVLVIGLGTANLMQRHLGLRYPRGKVAAKAVELIAARRTRTLDVGRVNGRPFLLMTSCGYDAGVVHALARVRAGPITKLSYVAPAVLQWRKLKYAPVTVTVDGAAVHADTPAQVFVGNVAEYGTGFPVLDEADSSDGLLDVCVLPCASHAQFVKLAWRLVRGGHRAAPGVVYVRGRDVRITSPEPTPVQIDGDAAGHTPVTLGLMGGRISFIVP